MAFLDLSDVRKNYGPNTVVHKFDLDVERGEFVSFLGPSGCGKTTTLRMVAGFEVPTAGAIRIDGRDITRLRPNQRNVGMVFQSYALFPNMTVADNVAFGLKIANKPSSEIKARVEEMLNIIKLPHLGGRYPYQLSGGQQQRVALARALAIKPQVLLLDEPLSALDAKIRVSLREEIRSLQRSLGITTIYVTHDQEEALSMSDRIVVMNEGRVEQIGTPFEIYNHPRTRFVASFVGTLNILKGKVVDPAAGKIVIDGQELFASKRIAHLQAGEACSAALRPEAASLHQSELQEAAKIASAFGRESGPRNRMVGTIEEVSFLGSVVRIRVRFKENAVSLDTFNNPNTTPPARGMQVTVSFAREDLLVLEGAEG
ncbi:ABC transporter ATP-binding protein [Dongia deserti]|uniref:ABC transporter ATP-binding protein n=1 Tax=Dongia deserti TaxID=2268030 RepID=UPI000E651920|nr:ABC transporter ATP-binding protein [Dongia deserti]